MWLQPFRAKNPLIERVRGEQERHEGRFEPSDSNADPSEVTRARQRARK